MVNSISISLSGLQAASQRLNATASNIANIQTVGSIDENGQAPYNAIDVVQQSQNIEGAGSGVRTEYVPRDPAFIPAFDPDSPFANADGIIGAPNIDLAQEAVNLSLAEISYKANIEMIKAAEEMSDELLDIFDDD